MMTYRIDATRRLRFDEAAARTFDAYRTVRRVEAGGILLGRVYASEIVVEAATTPNPADRAGRFFFDRSHGVAQAAVNAAWKASEGEQLYLGEWHSHPAKVAEPSGRDQQMILNNLHDAKMDLDFLVLLVLGTRMDWVGLAQNGKLRRLTRVTTPEE